MRPQHWVVEEVAYSLHEENKVRRRALRAIGKTSCQLHRGSRTFVLGALVSSVLGVLATIPLVAALNGIAVLKAYFLLFTGCRNVSAIPSSLGVQERFAVLTLVVLILLGGFFPQFLVKSRYEAAVAYLDRRKEAQPRQETRHLLDTRLIPHWSRMEWVDQHSKARTDR